LDRAPRRVQQHCSYRGYRPRVNPSISVEVGSSMDLLEYQARDIFAKHGVPVKTALEAIGVRVGKTPSETAALVRAAVSSG
jgi:hypothetical protein